jgi:hypothetical protein
MLTSRHHSRRISRVCLLVAILVVPASVAPVDQLPPAQASAVAEPPDPIFYPEFRDTKIDDDLHLNGDATTFGGDEWVLRLTDNSDDGEDSGSAWHYIKQPVDNRFQTTFQFRMSDSNSYGGIEHSVVVEFDTYPASCDHKDPNGDHVAIQLNGDPKHEGPNSLATQKLPQNFELGRVYTATISYEAPVISVTIDSVFVVSATVAITQVVGSDTAWVGFVAGTGAIRQNHDILNWYFTANWGLRCATFDFTQQSYDFDGASWDGGTPGFYDGWGGNGSLTIDRGVGRYWGAPLFESSGVETELLELITRAEDALPIRQIQIHYTHAAADATLTGSFDLDVEPGGGTDLISNSSSTGPDESYTEGRQPISIRRIDVPEADLSRAVHPTGIRITLSSENQADYLRIKKVGLCIYAGPPPRPMPMPVGSRRACQDLLQNIKTRRQPYGPADVTPGDSAQPEFQFPSDVVLETYPEFLSLEYGDGYPAPMTYADATAALVPCTFEQDGQLYPPAGEPIVRFTAVGGDAEMRGRLILLNYAGYYALAKQNWCYPGDNAFALYDGDPDNPSRSHSLDWLSHGPGYNVPPPASACDTGETIPGDGPCGSFVGSLFRALGYFNVDAFGEPGDVYIHSLHGLYYAVQSYVDVLPNSSHAVNGQQPFTHVDYNDPTQYVPIPISSFSGIRVYAHTRPLGDPQYGDPVNISWSVCITDSGIYDSGKCNALNLVSGHWGQAILDEDIEYSPLWSARPISAPVPLDIWRSIKPGDISFTVIGFSDGTVEYPHVQVVVGWGPPAWEYARADARRGKNLYSTYDAIPPDKQAGYVPYVMDRFRQPGEGSVPRPFNFDMLHTSTEFWVANE